MRVFPLLALISGLAFADSNRTACSLSPEVEREYLALPPLSDLSLSWQERYSPRRTLAEQHPDDWPLQVLLQEPIRNYPQLGREWDSAIAHYKTLSDRTLGEFLEARLLSGVQRKKSRDALDRILGQAGDSPWAHLALLEWAGAYSDIALAEREFETFRKQCPDSVLVFHHLTSLRDPEKLQRNFLALRKALESRKNEAIKEGDIPLFRKAWTWEKVAYGRDRADEFDRLVRSDLTALLAHPLYSSDRWIWHVGYGYEAVLQDGDVGDAVLDEIVRRAPTSDLAYSTAKLKWERENPRPRETENPSPDPTRAAAEAYRARRAAFLSPLIERFLGKPYGASDAESLLRGPALPADTFERMADVVVSNAERFPDQSACWPPVQIEVAEAYLDRKIRLDRFPALIQQALEQSVYQEKYHRDTDGLDKMPDQHGSPDPIAMTQQQARAALARYGRVTHQPERAQEIADRLMGIEAGDHPLAQSASNDPAEPERIPVAEFDAKDLSGKTWRLSDLKGKVAYVSVWGSSYGTGCPYQMPDVQKLYERWSGRNDRVVLTIAIGEYQALVESIIKENKYTVPVLYGKEIAEKFGPDAAICRQNWIIDPQGRRLARSAPSPSDADVSRIEELADKTALQE